MQLPPHELWNDLTNTFEALKDACEEPRMEPVGHKNMGPTLLPNNGKADNGAGRSVPVVQLTWTSNHCCRATYRSSMG